MQKFSDHIEHKQKHSSDNSIHKPHFRLTTLLIYFVFLILFNVVIAPAFGLAGNKSYGAGIDANRLVDLANQDRAQNGNLSQLTVDQRLVNAANAKAIDMFKKQYWAHYGPNGETPWQFIVGAGYSYTYGGENLAKDFTDTDAVNTAWMNSSTHRANILNTNYKNIGIAAVSGKQICNGTYPGFSENTLPTCVDTIIVVQMFGSPVGSQASPTVSPTKAPSPTSVPTQTLSPKITTAPVATPTPALPSVPTITSPGNGSNLNVNSIEIKGMSDDGTAVTVYEGDKKIGTVLSNGGAFDIKDVVFNDGQHIIKANAKINGNTGETGFSNEVNFTVDTQKPVFTTEDVRIQLDNSAKNEYTIEALVPQDVDIVTVTAGNQETDLIKKENQNVFSGSVVIPLGSSGIVVTAEDKAGNEYSVNINIPNTPLTNTFGLISSTSTDASSDSALTTRQTVNIIVGILILIVFCIDSLIVWKTGKHLSKETIVDVHSRAAGIISKKGSILHHIAPIVVAVVAITLSFAGKIV